MIQILCFSYKSLEVVSLTTRIENGMNFILFHREGKVYDCLPYSSSVS